MRSALTGQDVTSAFSRFYGSMDVIPFIGDNFNRAVPVFIALLAVFQVRMSWRMPACLPAHNPPAPVYVDPYTPTTHPHTGSQGLNVFNRVLQAFQLESLQFGDPPISSEDMEEARALLPRLIVDAHLAHIHTCARPSPIWQTVHTRPLNTTPPSLPGKTSHDHTQGLKKLGKARHQMEAAAQREERMRRIRGAANGNAKDEGKAKVRRTPA